MNRWSDRVINPADGHTASSAEMLWGRPPAAMIDEGVQRLIARLYAELHRHPEGVEIDEQIHGPTPAPEVVEGITKAARVFHEDVGRNPTPAEVQAWLLLVDSQDALLAYLELEIQVGDRVMWAERGDNSEFLRQTVDGRDAIVPAYGTVTAQPEGWYGENIITRDDGHTVVLGRKWLIKADG
jgi:hypothetical protein